MSRAEAPGIQEWISDVPMELGEGFWPLPVAVVPTRRLLFPSRLIDAVYDFGLERSLLHDSTPSTSQPSQAQAQTQAQSHPPQGTSSSPERIIHAERRPNGVASLGQGAVQASSACVEREAGHEMSPPSQAPPALAPLRPIPPPAHPPSFGASPLQPLPVTRRESPHAEPQTKPVVSNQLSRMSLEDFVATSSGQSPFDAVELNSIDDRALLKEVLG